MQLFGNVTQGIEDITPAHGVDAMDGVCPSVPQLAGLPVWPRPPESGTVLM